MSSFNPVKVSLGQYVQPHLNITQNVIVEAWINGFLGTHDMRACLFIFVHGQDQSTLSLKLSLRVAAPDFCINSIFSHLNIKSVEKHAHRNCYHSHIKIKMNL